MTGLYSDFMFSMRYGPWLPLVGVMTLCPGFWGSGAMYQQWAALFALNLRYVCTKEICHDQIGCPV